MNGFEVIRIINRMIDNTRSAELSYVAFSVIIDKDIKKWHNITVRDWW